MGGDTIMNTLNPEYKPHQELGETDADWDSLKATVVTYLQTNAHKAEVLTSDLRELDPKFSDDKLWAQISADLGLVEIC